jgi:hypothetical protein
VERLKLYWVVYWVALAGLLASCVAAATGQSQHAQPASPAHWQDVWVQDGGLRLRMPGQPQTEKTQELDFDGSVIRSTTGRFIGSNMIVGFSVMNADHGFINDPYEKASGAATKDSNDWTVRWKTESHKNGFRTADRVIDSAQLRASVRLHFVQGKTTIYSLFAAYPTHLESQSEWWVKEFLESASYATQEALFPMGNGTISGDAWEFIYPPEREFAAEIPGQPSSISLGQYLKGHDAQSYSFGVSDANALVGYRILVHEFADRVPKEAIEEARALSAKGIQVTSREYIHQRGFAGIDVVHDAPNYRLQARYFVTQDRLFEVLVWGKQEDLQKNEATRTRFLNSFRILTL